MSTSTLYTCHALADAIERLLAGEEPRWPIDPVFGRMPEAPETDSPVRDGPVSDGVEDIAGRAGVGVGTIYRRFPTKNALAEELGARLREHMHDIATESLAHGRHGHAFETYVLALCGLRSRYGRALVWLYGMPASAERLAQLKELTGRMIVEGQRAGVLRADLEHNDLGLLMWSVQGVLEATGDVSPEAWRLVEMIFAGWRATTTSPLRTRR